MRSRCCRVYAPQHGLTSEDARCPSCADYLGYLHHVWADLPERPTVPEGFVLLTYRQITGREGRPRQTARKDAA